MFQSNLFPARPPRLFSAPSRHLWDTVPGEACWESKPAAFPPQFFPKYKQYFLDIQSIFAIRRFFHSMKWRANAEIVIKSCCAKHLLNFHPATLTKWLFFLQNDEKAVEIFAFMCIFFFGFFFRLWLLVKKYSLSSVVQTKHFNFPFKLNWSRDSVRPLTWTVLSLPVQLDV